jgi:hypothetical protein
MRVASLREPGTGRGVPFVVAAAGAGALTVVLVAGWITLSALLVGAALAGGSTRCAASPHRIAVHGLPITPAGRVCPAAIVAAMAERIR